MRRNAIMLLLAWCAMARCGASGGMASAEVLTTTTRPCAGVVLTSEVRTDPPLRTFVARVDLTDRRLHLRVAPGGSLAAGQTPWETTLLPTSAIARREQFALAINGSFFAPKDARQLFGQTIRYFRGNPARACGWTMSDGRLWSQRPLARDFPSLVVWRNGTVSIGNFATPPQGAEQIVSGCALLLKDGINLIGPGGAIYPRSAAGLDDQRRTLILMVVDGHRPDYSVGLTMSQLGDAMKRAGAADAIALDSGGSSTLVVREGDEWNVVNRPSDGYQLAVPISVERSVADALGVVVEGGKR